MRKRSDWGKMLRQIKTGSVKPFKSKIGRKEKSGVLQMKRFAVRTKVAVENLRRKKSLYGR